MKIASDDSAFDTIRFLPPPSGQLEISVFGRGDGYGESIVVFVPGLGWGVIDSCKVVTQHASDDIVPALDYLIGLGINNLDFLCLTHAHRDHYEGLREIIRHYSSNGCSLRRVWVFQAVDNPEFRDYVARLHKAKDATATKLVWSFASLRDARRKGAEYHLVGAGTLLFEGTFHDGVNDCDCPVRVLGLTPSADDVSSCRQRIWSHMTRVGEPITPLDASDQNQASTALQIQVGETTVILGADVVRGGSENRGWRAVVNDSRFSLAATLVKVSHHGASSAFCQRAWKKHCERRNPVAALAPFVWGGQKLPVQEEIKMLQRVTQSLSSTSRPRFEPASVHYGRPIQYYRDIRLKQWFVVKGDQPYGQVRIRADLKGEVRSVEHFGAAVQLK